MNLLSDTLESLLDEAARASPQAWADRFDTLYKGRAVIIDATITATPDSAGSKRYELDYLVLLRAGTREQRSCPHRLTGFEAITWPAPGGRSGYLWCSSGLLPVRHRSQGMGDWLRAQERRLDHVHQGA